MKLQVYKDEHEKLERKLNKLLIGVPHNKGNKEQETENKGQFNFDI